MKCEGQEIFEWDTGEERRRNWRGIKRRTHVLWCAATKGRKKKVQRDTIRSRWAPYSDCSQSEGWGEALKGTKTLGPTQCDVAKYFTSRKLTNKHIFMKRTDTLKIKEKYSKNNKSRGYQFKFEIWDFVQWTALNKDTSKLYKIRLSVEV